jgi:hypothetical protein
MGATVSYDDCDCVPGHKCDCWDRAQEARAAVLREIAAKVRALPVGDGSWWTKGLTCVERSEVLALLGGAAANPVRTEQPEPFAMQYSGQHDDCIATIPHYHDRPYQPGDWSAEEQLGRRNWLLIGVFAVSIPLAIILWSLVLGSR